MYLRLLIIFLLCATLVSSTDIYDYESLTLQQEINNDIDIIPTKSDYHIEDFKITLHLYPEDDHRQEVTQSVVNPESATNIFIWNKPQDQVLSLETKFTVETSASPKIITEKIEFPLSNIPLEVEEFLEPTELIDINSDIRNLANQLAQGEDDLFILEHKLARWVNQNIEYNLSTIAAEANQPSSWVMQTRYGVCDELTNLFISLNRALGIPARFVSGIAYTDSILFETNWGNHGWAEVYFPGIGWVPYDVTYQQYGYLDATHISLDKEVDGGDPSIEYYTRGLHYEFEPKLLEFNTNIVEQGNTITPRTDFTANIQQKTVGFGSYNLISTQVTNKNNYYTTEDLTLVPVEDMNTLHNARQSVALKPFETQTIHWLVKISSDLNNNYIYTFPISIIPQYGETLEDAFSVQSRGEIYTKKYMEQFLNEVEEETASTFDCEGKKSILVNTEFTITCSGDQTINKICFQNSCIEDNQATFTIEAKNIGITTFQITGHTTEGTIQSFVTTKVNDIAQIEITRMNISPEAFFEDNLLLEVIIEKSSSAKPKEVTVELIHPNLQQDWYFSELNENKNLAIQLPANALLLGTNTFTIKVTYTDTIGQLHVIQKTTETKLVDLTIKEKSLAAFNSYSASIRRQLSKIISEEEQLQVATSTVITLSFVVLVIIAQKLILFIIKRLRN